MCKVEVGVLRRTLLVAEAILTQAVRHPPCAAGARSSTHRHRWNSPVVPAHEGAVAAVRTATTFGGEVLPLSPGAGRGGLRCAEQDGGGLRTGKPPYWRARSGVAHPAPTRPELHRTHGSRISVARDAGCAGRQRHPLRHAHGRHRAAKALPTSSTSSASIGSVAVQDVAMNLPCTGSRSST